MPFVTVIFLKSTLLLASAAGAAWLMRKAPAAERHLIWLFALAGILLIPLASVTLPDWTPQAAAQLAAAAPAQRIVVDVVEGSRSFRPELWQSLAALWALGCLAILGRFAAGVLRARALVRRARPFADNVRITAEIGVPVVCGVVRPVILIPESALDWNAERLRLVLAHEAMHIRRRDLVSQGIARLTCAVYWFHPLTWWAASRLRLESEQACDDGVLAQGEKASTYAGHLIDIVRGLSAEAPVPQGVIPMARVSELEDRLRAMFQPNRNRRGVQPRRFASIAVMAAAVLVPLAALQAPAQSGGAKIMGVVRDASGGAVPKARVIAALQGTDQREVTLTNAVGEFSLAPMPEGTYKIQVKVPGFAMAVLDGVTVSAARPQSVTITLALGQVQETVSVVGDRPESLRPPAIAMNSPEAPKRLKIGGGVQAVKLIKKVPPRYPADVKAEGIEGTVVLKAVISREGDPLNLEAVNRLVDPRLVQAATDAVKQWKWQPTLLNGEPVEVITEIEINFTLSK